MRKLLVSFGGAVGILLAWIAAAQPQSAASPEPLRFAVIGDNGNGGKPQYEVGEQMAAALPGFPYELVLMVGDNLYGRQERQDFIDKFERPYAAILGAGIPFFAALGNHDRPSNRDYSGFNMGGERYYTFARKNVRFVVLDTNLLDPPQIAWAEQTLKQATEGWKIAYFHHPLYSSGSRHGSNVELRVLIEPLLVRYGVSVVFSGHDHDYERTKPQKGITYFVEGASGQLRRGDMAATEITASSFDLDQTFMLVEIHGEELTFRTLSRAGRLVDSGSIRRRTAE